MYHEEECHDEGESSGNQIPVLLGVIVRVGAVVVARIPERRVTQQSLFAFYETSDALVDQERPLCCTCQ